MGTTWTPSPVKTGAPLAGIVGKSGGGGPMGGSGSSGSGSGVMGVEDAESHAIVEALTTARHNIAARPRSGVSVIMGGGGGRS